MNQKLKKALKITGIVTLVLELIGIPILVWLWIRERIQFKKLQKELDESTERFNNLKAESCLL